jgi:hypothetical protein
MGWRVFNYSGITFSMAARCRAIAPDAFLPGEDVDLVVLGTAGFRALGTAAELRDRVLGLPTKDWLGIGEDDSND